MHRYAFGPFTIHTEIKLDDLQTSEAAGIPLVLRSGKVPPALSNPAYRDQYCCATQDEFLLNIPDVAKYWIRSGSEIVLEAANDADPLDVRGYLLGNVFAIVCHQRRLLPLHASAVRMGSGVVAFLGASGAGKSSLAAFLAQTGYALVADDICLLDPMANPASRVLPVPPWLKLWRGSLTALGYEIDGLSQTFPDEDKFKLPVSRFPVVPSDPLPFAGLVLLHPPAGFKGVRLTRLSPAQAIAGMMKLTYQSFLLDWLGLQSEHFANCARSLGATPAYSCERAWGFECLPELAASLKECFEADAP